MSEMSFNILHVEDNPDHAELIGRGLRRLSIPNTVCLIEDGETALDYLFRRGEYRDIDPDGAPDIVLLDLRLPRVDGLDVLRTIKASRELQRLPVIILTSSDAEKDLAKSYEYHANSYLTKPAEYGAFSELLDELGQYWLQWNRYPQLSLTQ